jgi:hypothetical protein
LLLALTLAAFASDVSVDIIATGFGDRETLFLADQTDALQRIFETESGPGSYRLSLSLMDETVVLGMSRSHVPAAESVNAVRELNGRYYLSEDIWRSLMRSGSAWLSSMRETAPTELSGLTSGIRHGQWSYAWSTGDIVGQSDNLFIMAELGDFTRLQPWMLVTFKTHRPTCGPQWNCGLTEDGHSVLKLDIPPEGVSGRRGHRLFLLPHPRLPSGEETPTLTVLKTTGWSEELAERARVEQAEREADEQRARDIVEAKGLAFHQQRVALKQERERRLAVYAPIMKEWVIELQTKTQSCYSRLMARRPCMQELAVLDDRIRELSACIKDPTIACPADVE